MNSSSVLWTPRFLCCGHFSRESTLLFCNVFDLIASYIYISLACGPRVQHCCRMCMYVWRSCVHILIYRFWCKSMRMCLWLSECVDSPHGCCYWRLLRLKSWFYTIHSNGAFWRRLSDCHLYVWLYGCTCVCAYCSISVVHLFRFFSFVRSVCSKQKSIIVTTGYASTAHIGQNTKNSFEHMFCSVSCWRIIVIAFAAAVVDVTLLLLLFSLIFFSRFIQQGWRVIWKQRCR